LTAQGVRVVVSAMERTARRRKLSLVLLALIVAVAFALRVPIANRMLPQLPEPDAFQVLHAQEWHGDPALVKFWEYRQRYPKLLTYAFAAVPERAFDESATGAARLDSALAAAAAPYQSARYVVLFLSLLALPLTWIVARRFTGEITALLATWLVATSLLHALFSTQGRPHGVHLTAALFAIFAALRVVESGTWMRIFVAVLATGIAMGTLQNGAFTLIPLSAALFLTQSTWPRRITLAILLPPVAAALAFTVYPVLPSVDATGFHLGGALSHNVFFSDFTFGGFAVVTRWFYGHDPIFAALTVVGALFAIVGLARNVGALVTGRRAHVVIALAYVVPYMLLLLVTVDVYERFLLPLLPWFAILSVRPWRRFVDAESTRVAIAARVAIGIVLVLPLVVLARFTWVSTQPDTFRQAADWLVHDAETHASRIVATPYASLPLFVDSAALDRARGDSAFESRVWFAWQAAHRPAGEGFVFDVVPATLVLENKDFSALDAWLAARAPEIVVLEVSRKALMLPALAHLRTWVEARGTLAHRSDGPAPERIELGLADYQGIEDFARRLFGMRAFGPELEIWRIAR